MANVLTNLASRALYPCHMELNVMAHPSISDEAILIADTRISDSWMLSFSSYLKNGILLEEKKATTRIKARATRYALINDFCATNHFQAHTNDVFHWTRPSALLSKYTDAFAAPTSMDGHYVTGL